MDKYMPFQPPTNITGPDGVNRVPQGSFPSDVGMQFTQYNPNQQMQQQNQQMPQGMSYLPNSQPDMYGYGMGQNMDDNSQFKLDGLRILTELKHSLLGEIQNSMTGGYDKISDPMLSGQGVGKIIQILSFSIANVDHRLTKLSIDAINVSLKETRNNLRKELILNPIYRPRENIPLTVSEIRIILEEVCQCKESLLKRSLDGFTVSKNNFSEQHTYMHQDGNQQQGGGFMGKIFR